MQIAANATAPQTERCPWCETLIPHDLFNKIQHRIRSDEQAKLKKTELTLRQQLQQELQRKLEEQRKADKEAFEAKQKEDLRKATDALKEAKDLASKAMAEKEAAIKQMQEDTTKKQKAELDKQREILAKDRDTALMKKDAEYAREREKYKKTVSDLKRQLERQTANELGDGAEIDLHEELLSAYPDDKIVRVKKGEGGADIIHDVMYKGEFCQRIVYDSKNRKAWRDSYVTKLLEDKVQHQAQHAILSSVVFPSGAKELHNADGVMVVTPARAVTLVQFLRPLIIRLHSQGLSRQRHQTKMTELYRYITSDAFSERIAEAERRMNSLLELEVQEKKQHDLCWKQRGTHLKRLQSTISDLSGDALAIVEDTK